MLLQDNGCKTWQTGRDVTINPIETPFKAFANRADPDQAALTRTALSGSTLCVYGNIIYLILHKWT